MKTHSPEKPFLRKLVVAGVVLATAAGASALVYRFLPETLTGSTQTSPRETPAVVVSIAPLHSLVSSVMNGVGEPGLIMDAGQSPHGYALRPSDARALADADLVVWVGPELETAFARSLATISAKDPEKVLEVTGMDGLTLYPVRPDNAPDTGAADHPDDDHADHDAHDAHDDENHPAVPGAGAEDHGHHHHEGENDPHVWLDPANAEVIVETVARRLGEIDPEHAGTYRENARNTVLRLGILDSEIRSRIAGAGQVTYVSFHDGFQYFDRRYGAHPAGFLAFHPETPLSVGRTVAIRNLLAKDRVPCLFAEPQFSRDVVDRIVAGTPAQALTVDPLGYGITPGPDLYFQTMEKIARVYSRCTVPPEHTAPAHPED